MHFRVRLSVTDLTPGVTLGTDLDIKLMESEKQEPCFYFVQAEALVCYIVVVVTVTGEI